MDLIERLDIAIFDVDQLEIDLTIRQILLQNDLVSSVIILTNEIELLSGFENNLFSGLIINLFSKNIPQSINLIENIRNKHNTVPICLIGKSSNFIDWENVPFTWRKRFEHYYKIISDYSIEKIRVKMDMIILGMQSYFIKYNNGLSKDEAIQRDIKNSSILKDTLSICHPWKVFISYSWDNEEHKNWILMLTNKLRKYGIDATIDRYELWPGKNMLYFMEQSIEKSDKVLVVFTENYKLKAENRYGGVGFEYSILSTELYQKIINNNKYIPILRSGSIDKSIPVFMKQFITLMMTNDNEFDERFNELILAICNKPIIQKPPLG